MYIYMYTYIYIHVYIYIYCLPNFLFVIMRLNIIIKLRFT